MILDFKRPQIILGKSDCFEACCEGLKQAILFDPEQSEGELYCVGKLKKRSPKIICSLEFSLVTFFVSRQRK
jgi:hypothetical protein